MDLEAKKKNISRKKLPVVQSASFDTIIEALKTKSERAQCTFLFKLIGDLNGEMLAIAHKYSESEIKRRARVTANKK